MQYSVHIYIYTCFLPKYEQKIVRVSAGSMAQGRHPYNIWFIFWEKRRLHKFILKFTDLYYLYCVFNSSHYSKDKSSRGRLSSTTISDSFYSLMDQDLIVKWWEEIWQRSSHDNTFLSEFDPSPYSYEDTSFIGT